MRWHAALAVSAMIGGMMGGINAAAADTPAEAPMAAISNGSTVEVDYTLTVAGQVVDSSEGREPLRYVQGQGQIIPGLERELLGLHVGDTKDVTVSPEDGYGPVHPEAVIELPKERLPKDPVPQVGMILTATDTAGQPVRAVISSIGEESVTLDLNHPLAGKTLQFNVKVVKITPAS